MWVHVFVWIWLVLDRSAGCKLCWTPTEKYYFHSSFFCPLKYAWPLLSYATAFSLKVSHNLGEKCSGSLWRWVTARTCRRDEPGRALRERERTTLKPHPLHPSAPFKARVYFRARCPSDGYSLFSKAVLCWNSQGHTEIAESPEISARKVTLDVCDVNVICASFLFHEV